MISAIYLYGQQKSVMAPRTINVINVASDVGSIYAGKSRAPAAFRSAGLQQKLKDAGWVINEQDTFGGSPAGWTSSDRKPNGARNEARVVESCKRVSETVASALRKGGEDTFQLILSGECLYCPAILSAYSRNFVPGTGKKVGLVYIDADSDLHTPGDLSSSGNIAGMTLTHLTLRDGCLDSMRQFSRPDGSAVVDAENIVLFGLNENSETNKREHLGWLFDNSFRVVTSAAVQREPERRAQQALHWMEERVDQIIVHLDVDVIDPGEFPLCNVPNWTGLGFDECMASVGVFLGSEKCVGLSLAEVNPDHDPELKMTRRLVDKVFYSLQCRV